MEHREFVELYKNGKIKVSIDKVASYKLMDTNLVAKKYRAATYFWSWVWFLSIPAGIALIIWVNWWSGIIVLVVGFMLPRAIKKSSTEFILDQALEDERFYKNMLHNKVLIIEEK